MTTNTTAQRDDFQSALNVKIDQTVQLIKSFIREGFSKQDAIDYAKARSTFGTKTWDIVLSKI